MVHEIHSCNTRNSTLSLILPKINSCGEYFFIQCSVVWNESPTHIRSTEYPYFFIFNKKTRLHLKILVKNEEETYFNCFNSILIHLWASNLIIAYIMQHQLYPWWRPSNYLHSDVITYFSMNKAIYLSTWLEQFYFFSQPYTPDP